MKTLYPGGKATEYVIGKNEVFVPQKNCRAILIVNPTGNDTVKVNGWPVEAGTSFNVDVYPGEQIAGDWSLEGTEGDIVTIGELIFA